MARDAEVERRLLNWARSKVGGLSGGLGYSTVAYGDGTTTRFFRQAVIPIDACEADLTDRAVHDLAPTLRETIELLYLKNASTRDAAARWRLSEAAVYARLWKAHAELRTWFAERERRAADERKRTEQLQRQAAKR